MTSTPTEQQYAAAWKEFRANHRLGLREDRGASQFKLAVPPDHINNPPGFLHCQHCGVMRPRRNHTVWETSEGKEFVRAHRKCRDLRGEK